MKKLLCIFSLALFFMSGISSAQAWKESSGIKWNYDLKDVRILTVINEGFNYEEAVDVTNYWKTWGAKVDLAGTLPEHHGERNNPATGRVHDEVPAMLKPDMLLSEADYRKYDVIYFPGGEGVEEFLKSSKDELKSLIDGAIGEHRYVAAICHSPFLLSVSDNLKGRMMTVQGNEFRPLLVKAGAKIVSKIFVSDGYFMTGQWPYFETFAASVAEKLLYPDGNGPFEKSLKSNGPVLNGILDQRNVYMMKPGSISDDSIRLIIRHSVNPVLPSGMMSNSVVKFVAVKDPALKSSLIDELVKAGQEKFKSENIPSEVLKKYFTVIFSAPVVILVYNDLSEIQALDDKGNLYLFSASLAGQSIAQMKLTANELGYGLSIIGGMRSLIAEDGFRKVLNTPADYKLVNIVSIGHPLEFTNPAVVRPVNEYLMIK